jgi:hypothetical protein
VFLSSFAAPTKSFMKIAILAMCLSVGSVILFVYLLGQPIPVWGGK